jgi:hypothetical protein
VLCLLIVLPNYMYVFSTATCQREYESRAAVNTVVLHPNQVRIFIVLDDRKIHHPIYVTLHHKIGI